MEWYRGGKDHRICSYLVEENKTEKILVHRLNKLDFKRWTTFFLQMKIDKGFQVVKSNENLSLW